MKINDLITLIRSVHNGEIPEDDEKLLNALVEHRANRRQKKILDPEQIFINNLRNLKY